MMNNIYGTEARVALARCDGIAPPLALLLTVILHDSPRNLGPQYNINNNVWRVDEDVSVSAEDHGSVCHKSINAPGKRNL